MKKNRVLYILSAIVILIGILVAIFLGFQFDMELQHTKKINLYLDKQADLKDMEQIAKEAFEGQRIIVRKVGTFNDMFEVRLKDFTEEQKTSFVQKLNEKYETEIADDTNITVTEVPNQRGRDIIEPYFLPAIIVGAVALIYLAVRYRKLGWNKVLAMAVGQVVVIEAVYMSLIAITRLPISLYTMPVGMIIAMFTLMYLANSWEKKLASKIAEEKSLKDAAKNR